MDANLTAYSTETLENLLVEKRKKPQTDVLKQIIEAIESELQVRKERNK